MTVTASVVPLTPSSVVHKQMMMKVDRHSHDDEQLMFNMEDNVTTATNVTTTATTPINITATPTIQTSLAVSLLVYFTHTLHQLRVCIILIHCPIASYVHTISETAQWYCCEVFGCGQFVSD